MDVACNRRYFVIFYLALKERWVVTISLIKLKFGFIHVVIFIAQLSLNKKMLYSCFLSSIINKSCN